MATNSSRLNLTRDQLASFLIDHQQIKQFEMLFSAVDAIAPNVVLEINIAVGTAQATANNAIDQIIALGQDMAVNDAAMSAKVHQAMDAIPRLAQALELLAAAPVAQAQMPLFDDLTPRAELGTMAAQNAEKVAITGGTIAGITFGGFPAGTVSLPSLYWGTDTATGFYRIGLNNIGYSYNGTKLLDFSSTLLAITGGLSTTGAITCTLAGSYGLNLTGATTSSRGILFTSTGATTVLGIESSTGGGFVTGSPGYSTCLVTFDTNPVILGVNNAEKLRATTTGVAVTGALTASTSIKPLAAAGYLSSDGSAGYTGTVTTASLVGKTITIKDGIITAFA